MGNYTLIISKDAQKEITYFYKLCDKVIIRKLPPDKRDWKS